MVVADRLCGFLHILENTMVLLVRCLLYWNTHYYNTTSQPLPNHRHSDQLYIYRLATLNLIHFVLIPAGSYYEAATVYLLLAVTSSFNRFSISQHVSK
jgi:hypothetical protein